MATLIVSPETRLSERVASYLKKRSSGTEDIANRFCTSRDVVRVMLSRLKAEGVAEHDGRRPRTWRLKEQEAA